MGSKPRITVNGFKTAAHGTERVLGTLESAVMELLWREPGLTVREVQGRLERDRAAALTTVLTTLDRMYRKGYMLREKEGKAFVYSPRYPRREFERRLIREVLGALLGDFKAGTLTEFVDILGNDKEALDQLVTLAREKRLTRG